MNIGVITINDFGFHPNKRLREAANSRGHEVILMNPYHMTAHVQNGKCRYHVDQLEKSVDVILPRQGSPMGEYGLVLLRHLESMGIPLVNGLEGVTIARNQFVTLQVLAAAGIPVPDSGFITDEKGIRMAVQTLGGYPVVVKKVDGMGGDGVIKADNEQQVLTFSASALELKKGAVVQQFIPPEERTDMRVLVVGDSVAGAMQLTPMPNEFRTNIHQAGRAERIDPPDHIKKTAVQAARACHLQIAGIDIIVTAESGPMIIEVNYSPGFKGLESVMETDIAGCIIQYVESVFRKNQ